MGLIYVLCDVNLALRSDSNAPSHHSHHSRLCTHPPSVLHLLNMVVVLVHSPSPWKVNYPALVQDMLSQCRQIAAWWSFAKSRTTLLAHFWGVNSLAFKSRSGFDKQALSCEDIALGTKASCVLYTGCAVPSDVQESELLKLAGDQRRHQRGTGVRRERGSIALEKTCLGGDKAPSNRVTASRACLWSIA